MKKQLTIIAIATSVIASYYSITIVANTIRDVKHELEKRGYINCKAKEETQEKQNECIMGFHI